MFDLIAIQRLLISTFGGNDNQGSQTLMMAVKFGNGAKLIQQYKLFTAFLDNGIAVQACRDFKSF
jgi:hypothetical protein